MTVTNNEPADKTLLLDDKHLAEMHASGLCNQTIAAARIRTVRDGQIRVLLGWQPRDHSWGNGWVIPFDRPDATEGYHRVKLDYPRHNGKGVAIKYESPRGKPNRAYFPPGFDELWHDSTTFIFTEGEKKALAVSQLELPCIGLVGVWGWQETRPRSDAGRAFGPRRLISDLQRIDWKGKTVVVVFDSDVVRKPEVQLAETRLAETLKKQGADVCVARLPGGGDGKVGADDFIVTHGADAFRRVLADAKEPELPPAPDPMDWARMYVDSEQRAKGGATIRWHRDQFFSWNGRRYRQIPDGDMLGVLLQWLDERGTKATPKLASNVLKCLASEVRVPADVDPPAFLGRHAVSHPDWLTMKNGNIDLDKVVSGSPIELKPNTPRWFSTVALPYSYDANAECPTWFATLDRILDGDVALVDLLAEWFGYTLTTDTRLHAILLIEGPPRSGKGTILRTMRAVIGEDNCVSPRLAALAELFGLWGLVGKRLAICPDAHLGRGDKALAVLEILKLVSGEDAIEVHRKHLPSITMRLRIRFALAVNELPKFGDYAGALATRMLILPCRNSFAGNEDRELEAKLAGEVSGILRWAFDGLVRLRRQGEFTRPAASEEALKDFARLVSPLQAFLEEKCEVRPDAEVVRDDLWVAWCDWCEATGHLKGGREVFGSRLRATIPNLRTTQPRVDRKRVRTYEGIRLQ